MLAPWMPHGFHWASLMMTWRQLGDDMGITCALLWHTLAYYGILWHNMVRRDATWCNTVQDGAIPCKTMQYHALLITADGAYHCPVGSKMAVFYLYHKFKIDIHQQLRPLTANYLAMFKVTSTTICTGCPRKNTLIKFLDERSCSSPACRHCGQDSAAASRNGVERRRSPQPARPQCLRAGEEHDL